MRRAARVDANHAEITGTLRQCGWTVHDTSGVGGGFPDLVIAKGGRLVLVEIKDGAKKPSARRLTKAEAASPQSSMRYASGSPSAASPPTSAKSESVRAH